MTTNPHEDLGRPQQSGFQEAEALQAMAAEVDSEAAYRQRLVDITHQIEQTESRLWQNGVMPEFLRWQRSMRAEGAAGASALLVAVRNGELEPEAGFRSINLCATSDNIPELGAYMESERAVPFSLHDCLERIGTVELVPYLKRYMDQPPRPDEYHYNQERCRRMREAVLIGLAIEQRAGSPAEQAQMKQLTGEWLELYNNSSPFRQITVEEFEDYRASRHPDLVAMRYARMFFWNGEDPDFGPTARTHDKEVAPHPPAAVGLERVEVVKNLFALAGQPLALTDSSDRVKRFLEVLAYREGNPSQYAPTLGIEVEIREATQGSGGPNAARLSADERVAAAYERLANYRRTEKVGVRAGQDEAWEFAHQPASYYLTLSREVQALMQLDLINREHDNHPLHLTIAHLRPKGAAGNEVFLLARSLEATGWCTSGDRVLQPTTQKMNTWLSKGTAGVRERRADQIQLDADSAVEFRIFELLSLAGLNRMLRSAHALGAALWAYQQLAEAPDQPHDPIRHELAEIWKGYSSYTNDVFAHNGMTRPSEAVWSTTVQTDADGEVVANRIDRSYHRLARFLDEAEGDADSQGAQFQGAIQAAVRQARGRVMAVLKTARPLA